MGATQRKKNQPLWHDIYIRNIWKPYQKDVLWTCDGAEERTAWNTPLVVIAVREVFVAVVVEVLLVVKVSVVEVELVVVAEVVARMFKRPC
jgi:hypothetical protein